MGLCPRICAPPVAPPCASVSSRRQRGAQRLHQAATLIHLRENKAEGGKAAGWMQAACVRAIGGRRGERWAEVWEE